MTSHRKAVLGAVSATAMLWSASALAQAAEPPAAAPGREAEAGGEIIVTGSRIARKDYSAESPIVTIGQELIKSTGPSTLEASLNLLPQVTPDAGANSASQAAGGRATVNLRGLGPARTLVLLDGRRLQPGDPLGAIDLNSIPSALIENVEVITGGASAAYGSDAIAGVVNFRLAKNFEGLALDADAGLSERGDGQSYTLSGTVGGNFAEDRGNAVLSVSYFDRQRVNRGSRKFFQDGGITSVLPSGLIYPVATNLPSQAAINRVFASYGLSGVTRAAAYSLNPDKTLFTINPVGNFRFPKDGPYVITSNGQVAVPLGEAAPLQQPLQRETVFGRVNYNLTDGVAAYAQFNYAHYKNNQTGYGKNQAITRDVYLPVTNPFIPADLRAIAASRADPNAPLLLYFNTGRFSPDIAEQTYDVGQYLGGLRGDIDAIDGGWDVFGSYGRTKQQSHLAGYVDRAAYLALIEARDGGVSLCEGGLDPLSLAKPSADCLDYMLRELHETTSLAQVNLEANFQGRLFTLPAGNVRFATGLSYRRNRYSFSPDEQRTNATVLAAGISNPTLGHTESKEAYFELLVPVLADLPLIHRLELDAAYRYSDYDTVGGVHTYKISGNWAVTPALSLRGGYQRAIRAPSVGELYQPVEQSGTTVGRISAGLGDPCDIGSVYRTGASAAQVRALCIATGLPAPVVDLHRFSGTSVQSNLAGNLGLTEETSDTYTLGAVWRSNWSTPMLADLSASVDYYNIKIKDAIGLVTGDVITQRCFNGASDSNPTFDPNNFYCRLIHRGVSGGFTYIDTPLLNLAGYRTSGIDVQVDWSVALDALGLPADAGRVRVNVLASYLDKYAIQTLQGAAFAEYAGTIGNGQISSNAISHPRWRTVTSLSYDVGPAALNLRWRWTDKMSNAANVGITNAVAPGVKAISYFDLNVRIDVNKAMSLRLGVTNLTDRQPPQWTGESATDPNLYDVVGRRFFAGVSARF